MAIFNLTDAQIAELKLLVDSKRDLPTGQKGLNQAYLKLAGYITTSNGSKLEGVGGSIWHFINAAANINKDAARIEIRGQCTNKLNSEIYSNN
jgi:hypothetical protein